MKHYQLWFKSIGYWLAENIAQARWFLIALFIVLLAIVYIILGGRNEAAIRITGMVLQLIGISAVMIGIDKTRRDFGLRSILGLLHQSLSRFPSLRREYVMNVKAGEYAIAMGKARVYISSNVGPDASIEERVQVLETNIKRVNDRVDEIQNEIDQESRKHTEAIRQEQQLRIADDQDLRTKLMHTATGGLDISLGGALMLIFGVIMSSMSIELALLVSLIKG